MYLMHNVTFRVLVSTLCYGVQIDTSSRLTLLKSVSRAGVRRSGLNSRSFHVFVVYLAAKFRTNKIKTIKKDWGKQVLPKDYFLVFRNKAIQSIPTLNKIHLPNFQ